MLISVLVCTLSLNDEGQDVELLFIKYYQVCLEWLKLGQQSAVIFRDCHPAIFS